MSHADPKLAFDASSLPIAQLESLRFKANQILDSIQTLQRTIELGNQPAMQSWPDILSKYNLLLSQTHNFSTSLVSPIVSSAPRVNGATPNSGNPYEKIALHPSKPLTDRELDNDVAPLLRNQQTIDVLKQENDTVRRLSEHMSTRGSLGVLSGAATNKPEYEDVLRECQEIKEAHDRRVDRAVRAVIMLRDKGDWKARVQVEVEEPEELEWDPRLGAPGQGEEEKAVAGTEPDSPADEDSEEEEEGINTSLVVPVTPASFQTPGSAPDSAAAMDVS